MNYQEARNKVEAYIAEQPWGGLDRMVILDDQTIEKEYGWAFFYQSKQFLLTGEIMHRLAGNAPIIVNRYSGELIETGTAKRIDYYLDRYEEKLTGILKVYRLELSALNEELSQIELLTKIKKIHECNTPVALQIIGKFPLIMKGNNEEVWKWHYKYDVEDLITEIIKDGA